MTGTLVIEEVVQAQPGTLRLTADNLSIREDGQTQSVSVERIGGTDGAVTVDYSVSDGSATKDLDYQAADGVLTWLGGVGGVQSFEITILDDSEVENDETVNILISGATGFASIGSPRSATLTIRDDDEPALDPIFSDGFESGDTSRWSSSVPSN